MGGFGISSEMIFLFLLALVLFGPKKLPELGRQIGRIMNEFRRASFEFRSQIESEIGAIDSQKRQILPPIREPLGSLASRILNPPSIEELRKEELKKAGYRAYEDQAIPATSAENAAAVPSQIASGKAAPENAPAVEPGLAPSPAKSSAIPPQAATEKAASEKAAPDA